jgi:hypothetical protein
MPKRRPPAYLRHRAKNLGYSRIDGQQVYFPGPWNSAESRAAYEARFAVWRKDADREAFPFTVADLAANYIDWADGYFTKHGAPTRHATNIRAYVKLLLEQHRRTLICEFTPPVFGDWLDSLDGTRDRRCKHQKRLISRQYINKVRTAVLRMFQWGVRKGMVAPNHPAGLREIPGLAKGHTKAPDAPRVEPVDTADVAATLPFLTPPVRAIVELMRLTGMRPGEATVLRPEQYSWRRPEPQDRQLAGRGGWRTDRSRGGSRVQRREAPASEISDCDQSAGQHDRRRRFRHCDLCRFEIGPPRSK